jgi:Family of unknown function (DUF5691)
VKHTWPDVLAAALVGTARTGGQAEALLDDAAALALRRRAGVALVHNAQPPPPAPVDDVPAVSPAAAARAGDLLAIDAVTRKAGPVRDTAGRLELLAQWLTAAAAAGRRLPPELVPALLDAGRRHHPLRPLIAPVAGPLAGWLATQRPDWAYASSAARVESDVDDNRAWELGGIRQRTAYLARLRRHDPTRARRLLEAAWAAEPPDDRAALLGTFRIALSTADEPVLERALDDRRRQVRDVAHDLLGRLPGSAYAKRMAERAAACVDLGVLAIRPPVECDRSMRRDGIAVKPPAGVGERAWWLEEVLARTPLSTWPEPAAFLAVHSDSEWTTAVRRGLARAAATQRDSRWAAALVDRLTAEVLDRGQPEDRLLLEALYDALPPRDLATRAAGALRRGLVDATAVGIEHVLELCPRPWPPAVAEAVFAALAEQLSHRAASWRVTGVCELAALRLPADHAARAAALAERLRAARPNDWQALAGADSDKLHRPVLAALERLAMTLKYRQEMLEELS